MPFNVMAQVQQTKYDPYDNSQWSEWGLNMGSRDREIERSRERERIKFSPFECQKCHPDKCQSTDPAKAEMAKLTFQELQEAYSVLSDNRRRALYDSGLEEEDTEELGSFWQEMTSMMADARTQNANGSRQTSSFEDLQHLFVEMFSADLQNMFGNASGGFAKMSEKKPKKTSNCTGQQHSSHTVESKRRRSNPNPQSNS